MWKRLFTFHTLHTESTPLLLLRISQVLCSCFLWPICSMLLLPLLSVLLPFLLPELVPGGETGVVKLICRAKHVAFKPGQGMETKIILREKGIWSLSRRLRRMAMAAVISPGLPASAAVPHSAEWGEPVGVSVRAVVKVGSDSVWWKLPKLLLFLWKKPNEVLLMTLNLLCLYKNTDVFWGCAVYVWTILTVLEEILQRRADLGVRCGARRPLQRIILEPRRDGAYNATNKRWVCDPRFFALVSWLKSGFLMPTWLYLYEHSHCLMNPGVEEAHQHVSNTLKIQLQFHKEHVWRLFTWYPMKVRPCPAALQGPSTSTMPLPAGRSDPCGVNSELLPRHDESNLPQFVLLTKWKRGWKARGRSLFTWRHSPQMHSCLWVHSTTLVLRHADIDSGKAKRGSYRKSTNHNSLPPFSYCVKVSFFSGVFFHLNKRSLTNSVDYIFCE